MPAQAVVVTGDEGGTRENRYTLAGWIALTQAIIFPVAFAVGMVEQIIGQRAFGYHGPVLGLSELLMIAFTVMGVYTINKFRELLRECHDYKAIDTLLLATIWWMIAFQAGSLLLSLGHIAVRPLPEFGTALMFGSFLGVFMIAIGVVDIIIGIRLLREKDRFSQLMRAFAYVSLIAGVAEVSVIFTPVAMVLVPVTCLIMGLVFLREKHEVEFV